MEPLIYIVVGVILAIAGHRLVTKPSSGGPTPPSVTVKQQLEERAEILKEEREGVQSEFKERKKSFLERYSKYIRK